MSQNPKYPVNEEIEGEEPTSLLYLQKDINWLRSGSSSNPMEFYLNLYCFYKSLDGFEMMIVLSLLEGESISKVAQRFGKKAKYLKEIIKEIRKKFKESFEL